MSSTSSSDEEFDDNEDMPGLVSDSESNDDSDSTKRSSSDGSSSEGEETDGEESDSDESSSEEEEETPKLKTKTGGIKKGFLNSQQNNNNNNNKKKKKKKKSGGVKQKKTAAKAPPVSDEEFSDLPDLLHASDDSNVSSESSDSEDSEDSQDSENMTINNMPTLVESFDSSMPTTKQSSSSNNNNADDVGVNNPLFSGLKRITKKMKKKQPSSSKSGFQSGFLNSKKKKKKNNTNNQQKVNTKKKGASNAQQKSHSSGGDPQKSSSYGNSNNNKKSNNHTKKKPRRNKKEQQIFNYIIKRKKTLEKELKELNKYANIDNYTGKLRSAFENNKYITCTNIKVAIGFFQFALSHLKGINTEHDEILKPGNKKQLDFSDVATIYGYRFREVNDSKKRCNHQFYEAIQCLPLMDLSLDYRNDLTQRLKQIDQRKRKKISLDATNSMLFSLRQYKYMTNTLFLGNPNFFLQLFDRQVILGFFHHSKTTDGKKGEPLWDMISKYYETNVTNIQTDFPVWNPEFGKRLFSELKPVLINAVDKVVETKNGTTLRKQLVESLIHDHSDDYILLEGIKLLRAAPKFNKILQASVLSKGRRFELIRVMLRILKEDNLLQNYFYEVEKSPVFTLIELNLKGDKVEYLNLIEMFISEFGFDPLVFCKLNPNGRTTNTFRLILDMYFKDELGQKTVKKYLEYFMLDLEKSYNVYEKVMDDKNYGIFDGKSVKQYFESKYEKVNKHRKKKGDWKRMIADVQKERKKRKQKAKRQRKKANNNNDDNFDGDVNDDVKTSARAPKPLKKTMKNTDSVNKKKSSIPELLHNDIVNIVDEFTNDTDWISNLNNNNDLYNNNNNIDEELLRRPPSPVAPSATTDTVAYSPPSTVVSAETRKKTVSDVENPIDPNNERNPKQPKAEVADHLLDQMDFDPASFDSGKHVWEVVFCRKVKDFFKKQRKKNFHTCVRMMKTISELATGNRWKQNERLKKGVTHTVKDKLQLNLFEAKPSQSERILWEITPETSKRHGDTREVIRIWDIVLDHDNLSSAIIQVRKAHKLGQESRKKWKWKFKRKQFISDDEKTYPAIYVRHGENDIQNGNVNASELTEQYFFIEPDTAKFNPIRHYFIDSSAATALLYFEEDDDFELESGGNEQETRIITRGLNPDPRKKKEKESSILLLGRSGTGKTTCLIYRLFNEFKLFWKRRKQNEEKRVLLREERQAEINQRNAEKETDDDEEIGDENLETEEDGDDEIDIAQDEFDEFDGEDFGAIFITKSQVLRSECLKQFKKLRAGLTISEKVLIEEEEDRVMPEDAHPLSLHDLPASFYREDPERANLGTQIQMGTFPMFLTADAYWRMLDNTLPGERVKYFQHRPVPSDKPRTVGDIVNMNQDNPLDGLEELPVDEMNLSSDSDYTDSEDDEIKEIDNIAFSNINYIEVTFEIFVKEFWGKIKNVKNDKYNAAVVWGEIRSHIKGSIHSYTHETPLTRQEYTLTEVGKKQSNLSEAERNEIYDMYQKYERMRKQAAQGEKGISWYYDIMDALQEIIPRLKKFKASSADEQNKVVPVFTSYVDEIQDFTQVETAIIINFCKDPNRLVLAGDTAQNICSGISFRFEDIKSMFYKLNESLIKENEVRNNILEDAEVLEIAVGKKWKTKTKSINVPSEKDGTFCHLNLNFRSHDGVLLLAASVVELLYEFFPVSIDKLDPDNGIKDGPKPVLFKSGNGHDLLMMLLGSRDTSTKVPFGASQAILVRSKGAIKALPKELSVHPLILTINESKGLEFDGILLYNFFKNSKATEKTWRCIAKYMDRHKHKSMQTVDGEMSHEEFQTYCDEMKRKLRSRAKDFEETSDRILESELKLLYTAITRAKSNVWIFDDDDNKSIPMFEYFERRKLVKIVQSIEDSQNANANIAQSATNGAYEWIKQARVFEKSASIKKEYEERKRFYKLAKGCYDKAVEENNIAMKTNADLITSTKKEEDDYEDVINEGMINLHFDKTSSIKNRQNENKEHLQKQNKYCEEQIVKCEFELLLANSQYIKSTQPKKYVESLLEAAKAAAVAFKMTRRKIPYGKYLLSIYYNLAKHVETKNGSINAKKYYEIAGNLSYTFGELQNAKSFFEKAGDKESVAKIETYLKGNTNDSSSDYTDSSDDEKISDTAQIENTLNLVKMMDEERNKTLKNRRKKRFNKRKMKKGKKKKSQSTKKNAKRPALNVEDDY